MNKRCGRCKLELPIKCFGAHRKKKYQSYCKRCTSAYSKARYDNPDNKLKDSLKERTLIQRALARELIAQAKLPGCSNCNERDPICMEFHHTRDKLFAIGDAIRCKYSLTAIRAELEKCILLCANCHRKYHKNYGTIKRITGVGTFLLWATCGTWERLTVRSLLYLYIMKSLSDIPTYEVLPAEVKEKANNCPVQPLQPNEVQDTKAVERQDAEYADWLVSFSMSMVAAAPNFACGVIAAKQAMESMKQRRDLLRISYGAVPKSDKKGVIGVF